MGRAGQGRPAKPTSLKVLHGDHKKNPRRLNANEPTPASGPVQPPSTLSDAALAVWERLGPDLQRTGVLTPWDADEFAVVCDAVARWQEASRVLDEEGPTGVNRFGERIVSPWFRVWMDASSALAKFGGRFGLSPSDRATLKVGDADTQKEDDILTG